MYDKEELAIALSIEQWRAITKLLTEYINKRNEWGSKYLGYRPSTCLEDESYQRIYGFLKKLTENAT